MLILSIVHMKNTVKLSIRARENQKIAYLQGNNIFLQIKSAEEGMEIFRRENNLHRSSEVLA